MSLPRRKTPTEIIREADEWEARGAAELQKAETPGPRSRRSTAFNEACKAYERSWLAYSKLKPSDRPGDHDERNERVTEARDRLVAVNAELDQLSHQV